MIYFDHAATTQTDPRVLEAMLPYFSEKFGNPSSIYRFGQEARKAVDDSRERTAQILECEPREVIFTSGGTESNNFFILGAAEAYESVGKHIITTKIEHDSVLSPLKYLEERGFEVTYLDVGEDGIVDPHDLKAALRKDTIFVSIIYANNEIGMIQPITELAKIISDFKNTRRLGHSPARTSPPNSQFSRPNSHVPILTSHVPIFHTDACQAAPYLALSVKELGVDAMTINGGKIYGPKGVGALYLRQGITLVPRFFGGGQEHRLRSGTENVPSLIGFAQALELVQENREIETKRLLPLRDRLIDGLLKNIPETRLNGDRIKRLPNNVNVSFKGLEGEAILMRLDMIDVAASSGSACTSGSLEPSHVIRALGLDDAWTHSSTRFTLGHGNTQKEVDFVLEKMPLIIRELRETSPFV